MAVMTRSAYRRAAEMDASRLQSGLESVNDNGHGIYEGINNDCDDDNVTDKGSSFSYHEQVCSSHHSFDVDRPNILGGATLLLYDAMAWTAMIACTSVMYTTIIR